MKNRYLETGKVVGTHGVKGMARVQLWADSQDFLSKFKRVYTDKNGENKLEIIKAQAHGNVCIVAFKGINTIEEIEKYRGTVLYIDRNDIKLPKGHYFIADLIGCNVIDADTTEALGVITEVSETGANDVWHILKDNKEYLVPAIPPVIVKVDTENDTVIIRPLKGIFDDED